MCKGIRRITSRVKPNSVPVQLVMERATSIGNERTATFSPTACNCPERNSLQPPASPGDQGSGLIYLGNELNADHDRCVAHLRPTVYRCPLFPTFAPQLISTGEKIRASHWRGEKILSASCIWQIAEFLCCIYLLCDPIKKLIVPIQNVHKIKHKCKIKVTCKNSRKSETIT